MSKRVGEDYIHPLPEYAKAVPALPPVRTIVPDDYIGPTEESNWVIFGRLLVGAYPASVHDDANTRILTGILKLGASTFVCLQQEYQHEGVREYEWRSGYKLRPYIFDAIKLVDALPPSFFPGPKPDGLEFIHFPIQDCSIANDASVLQLCTDLVARLVRGENMYLHCWGGHGRTGTVVSIMLGLLYGLPPLDAMRWVQFCHDLRIAPMGVPSPQTEPQRQQVIRILNAVRHAASSTSKSSRPALLSPQPSLSSADSNGKKASATPPMNRAPSTGTVSGAAATGRSSTARGKSVPPSPTASARTAAVAAPAAAPTSKTPSSPAATSMATSPATPAKAVAVAAPKPTPAPAPQPTTVSPNASTKAGTGVVSRPLAAPVTPASGPATSPAAVSAAGAPAPAAVATPVKAAVPSVEESSDVSSGVSTNIPSMAGLRSSSSKDVLTAPSQRVRPATASPGTTPSSNSLQVPPSYTVVIPAAVLAHGASSGGMAPTASATHLSNMPASLGAAANAPSRPMSAATTRGASQSFDGTGSHVPRTPSIAQLVANAMGPHTTLLGAPYIPPSPTASGERWASPPPATPAAPASSLTAALDLADSASNAAAAPVATGPASMHVLSSNGLTVQPIAALAGPQPPLHPSASAARVEEQFTPRSMDGAHVGLHAQAYVVPTPGVAAAAAAGDAPAPSTARSDASDAGVTSLEPKPMTHISPRPASSMSLTEMPNLEAVLRDPVATAVDPLAASASSVLGLGGYVASRSHVAHPAAAMGRRGSHSKPGMTSSGSHAALGTLPPIGEHAAPEPGSITPVSTTSATVPRVGSSSTGSLATSVPALDASASKHELPSSSAAPSLVASLMATLAASIAVSTTSGASSTSVVNPLQSAHAAASGSSVDIPTFQVSLSSPGTSTTQTATRVSSTTSLAARAQQANSEALRALAMVDSALQAITGAPPKVAADSGTSHVATRAPAKEDEVQLAAPVSAPATARSQTSAAAARMAQPIVDLHPRSAVIPSGVGTMLVPAAASRPSSSGGNRAGSVPSRARAPVHASGPAVAAASHAAATSRPGSSAGSSHRSSSAVNAGSAGASRAASATRPSSRSGSQHAPPAGSDARGGMMTAATPAHRSGSVPKSAGATRRPYAVLEGVTAGAAGAAAAAAVVAKTPNGVASTTPRAASAMVAAGSDTAHARAAIMRPRVTVHTRIPSGHSPESSGTARSIPAPYTTAAAPAAAVVRPHTGVHPRLTALTHAAGAAGPASPGSIAPQPPSNSPTPRQRTRFAIATTSRALTSASSPSSAQEATQQTFLYPGDGGGMPHPYTSAPSGGRSIPTHTSAAPPPGKIMSMPLTAAALAAGHSTSAPPPVRLTEKHILEMVAVIPGIAGTGAAPTPAVAAAPTSAPTLKELLASLSRDATRASAVTSSAPQVTASSRRR